MNRNNFDWNETYQNKKVGDHFFIKSPRKIIGTLAAGAGRRRGLRTSIKKAPGGYWITIIGKIDG